MGGSRRWTASRCSSRLLFSRWASTSARSAATVVPATRAHAAGPVFTDAGGAVALAESVAEAGDAVPVLSATLTVIVDEPGVL